MLRKALLVAALSSVACNGKHPVTPIAQPPSIGDVVKTCAFAVSCLKNPPTTQLGVCANVLRRALASQEAPATIFPTYVDCARDASDCASVLNCASRGHDPTYCAAHPGPSCDGDLLVYCAASGGTVDWSIEWTDCAALGMHCMQANGATVCSDGTNCDPALTPSQCAGNTYVTCDRAAHLLFREDCVRSGIINITASDPPYA